MKTYKYFPKWRKTSVKITVVQFPDAQWFANVKPIHEERKRQMVRFALMSDGELYFGDAFDVIHHDICQIVGPAKSGPLLVGVMDNPDQGSWKILNTQWFMGAPSDETTRDAKKLLSHFDSWQSLPVDVVW